MTKTDSTFDPGSIGTISALSLEELLEIQVNLQEHHCYLDRENRAYSRELQQGIVSAHENLAEVRAEQLLVHELLASVGTRIGYLEDIDRRMLSRTASST